MVQDDAPVHLSASTDQPLVSVVAELREVVDAIRAVYRSLADDPVAHGPREAHLDDLRRRRDELARQVGDVIVQVVASGGEVLVRTAGAYDAQLGAGDPQHEQPVPPAEPVEDETVTLADEDVPDASVDDEPLPALDDGGATLETPTIVDEGPPGHSAEPEPVEAAPPTEAVVEPARVEEAPTADAALPAAAAYAALPAPEAEHEPAADESPVRARPARVPATAPPPAAPRGPAPATLAEFLDAIGEPYALRGGVDAAHAFDRVVYATEHIDSWLVFDGVVQKALTGLVSSIMRHLQDEVPEPLHAERREAMRAWFSRMTVWSRANKPGFVPGLSKKFRPEGPSWVADAERWWGLLQRELRRPASPPRPSAPRAPRTTTRPARAPVRVLPTAAEALEEVERALHEPDRDLGAAIATAVEVGVGSRDARLLRLLAPQAERVFKLPGLKTVKTALREHARREPDATETTLDESRADPVPADWPLFELTEGKAAVVFGGDRRPGAAERMREAFRFASCSWQETDPRRVEALVGRIRANNVDIVIILRRYVSHAEADALIGACKQTGVPFALVDHGYGVAQVRMGLERYLGGRVEAAG